MVNVSTVHVNLRFRKRSFCPLDQLAVRGTGLGRSDRHARFRGNGRLRKAQDMAEDPPHDLADLGIIDGVHAWVSYPALLTDNANGNAIIEILYQKKQEMSTHIIGPSGDTGHDSSSTMVVTL